MIKLSELYSFEPIWTNQNTDIIYFLLVAEKWEILLKAILVFQAFSEVLEVLKNVDLPSFKWP